jgi:hypothetical protein
LRATVITTGASTYCLAKKLVGILGSLHIKNSADFIRTLSSLHGGPQDITVSNDVVSLFTRLLIRDDTSHLGRHYEEGILRLFTYVLSFSCFSFCG